MSQNATIKEATLELKMATSPGYIFMPENKLIMYPITQKWKENEVSLLNASDGASWEGYSFTGLMTDYKNIDIDTDKRITSSDNDEAGSWVAFDVTEIVQEMLKDPDKYDGFLFAEGLIKEGDNLQEGGSHEYDTANSYNNPRYFYASEHQNEEDRPKLTITFEGEAVLHQQQVAPQALGVVVDNHSIHIMNNAKGDLQFALYDMRGRQLVEARHIKAGLTVTLPLGTYAKGVYTLKGVSSGVSMSKTVVLK